VGKPTLTSKDAEEIRWIRALQACPFPQIADLYGVSAVTIGNVCHGNSFKGAGGPIEPSGTFRAYTVQDPPHGGAAWWYRGCRCDECRDWNADRCAEWRRRTGNNGHRKVR
jgi:hypothetical protein